MKNLKQLAVLVFLMGTVVSTSAQENPSVSKDSGEKTSYFRQFKDKIEFRTPEMKLALQNRKGQKTRIYLAPDFTFEGEVTEKTNPHSRLSSMIMRSSNLKGAIFTLSEIREEDGTVSYTGRIFHPESGEAYLLTRDKDKYYFVKTNSKFLLVN